MLETRNVQQILEQLAHPQERKEPDQDVREARHIFGALRNKYLAHVFAQRHFLEVDARREESSEAHNERQGSIYSLALLDSLQINQQVLTVGKTVDLTVYTIRHCR